MIWQKFIINFNYIVATFLFCIGLLILVTKNNLIKKFLGLHIMESGVFLFAVSLGVVKGGTAPILKQGANIVKETVIINPLPHFLALNGIIGAVCITAVGLALVVKVFQCAGTLDASKILKMKDVWEEHE